MGQPIGFFKSSVITFGSKLIFFGLSLAVGVILTRALGPSGRGQFALYFSLSMLVMVVAKIGVEVASMYYLSKNEGHEKDIAGTCLVSGIVFGVGAGLCPFVFFGLTGRTLYPGFMEFGVYACMITVPGMLLKIYARMLLLGKRKIYTFNLVNWLNQIFMLTGIVLVIQTGVSVDRMVFVHMISIFLTTLIVLYLLHNAELLVFRFKWQTFLKLIKFGITTSIGNTCKNLMLRIDILILGSFVSSDLIGYYSVAVGFAELMFKLPESLASLIMHWSAKEEKNRVFIETVYKNLFYIIMLSAVAMYIVASPAIKLLYPGFEASIPITYILLPAIWMYCMFTILGSYLTGNALTKEYMSVCIIAFLTNILLNVVLIPVYAIEGAALATLISYTLLHALAFGIIKCKKNFVLTRFFILEKKDIALYTEKLRAILP